MDPRTADAYVVEGPLKGERLVNLGQEPVDIDGTSIYLPQAAPGIAELATVASAEVNADQLISQVSLSARVGEDGFPYQPDETLALDARATAGTVAIVANVGLVAFANYHIARVLGDEPQWEGGDPYRIGLVERYRALLPTLLERPRPTQESWWPVLRRINGLSGAVRHPRPGRLRKKGLEGERTLEQRLFGGEYRGATAMLVGAFNFFSPGWVPQRKLAAFTNLASRHPRQGPS
jgi:hypothetical protein